MRTCEAGAAPWPTKVFPSGPAGARDRMVSALAARVGADGAVRDPCGSRVLESALAAALLERTPSSGAGAGAVREFLRTRMATGTVEGAERSLAAAVLDRRAVASPGSLVRQVTDTAPDFTARRKQALVHAFAAAVDEGFLPSWDEAAFDLTGLHSWAAVQVTASKVILARATGNTDRISDEDVRLLLDTQGRPHLWEGNVLIHLSVLHALSGLPGTAATVRQGLNGPGDDGLERRRIGRLVGRCMPGAPFGVARLVARHLAWVFHFDDTVAEHADRLAAHRAWDPPAVLRSGRLPAGAPACAHLTSLISLREDIVASGGSGLLPLLADGLRRYAESCAREAPWRASGTPPTLAEYLALRVHTSGGHPMNLHLLAPGMPSGRAPLTAPLTGLAELALLIGALANDLLGHAAEQRQGDPVNAVTVLAHEYGLPAPEAYRAAVVLHAGHQHRFDAACAGLLADATLSEAQRRFVHAVMGWVAGSAAAVEPYWHHLLTTHPTRGTG
ncbi:MULTISPECIES: terpene synthase family protein [unclassified Streptomyces]|uniref:terpene synthase family protein n=1 Tax=unclassified Streptomyces TaxID=2593676 RepID=UPI0009D239BF|nr:MULTISPECIES: terpene synthase family protein [unclassified Streptomyces]ONI54971.1 Terpene synthase family, metal binding domain [Streptomyces sp. IB2014 011-1]